MPRLRLLTWLVLFAALGLAACDTAEERAAGHHERAKALLAEGKVEQAIVEFRNVFRLDGENGAARLDYANLMVEQGRIEEAVGQFLRLVEQDWGNVAGHKRLTELALRIGDFETARTHANRAWELDPADPEIRAFKATVDYQAGEREAAVRMAQGVLDEAPSNLPARMVLVADRMQAGDAAAALGLVEAGLGLAPGDETLHLARLAVLESLGDRAAVGDQLEAMAGLFPENDAVALARIERHLQAGDIGAAEPLLRARAAALPPGSPERVAADLALVQALGATRGMQAARAELEALAAAAADQVPYARALAGLDVAEGRTAEGVAALRRIVAETEPSDGRRDTQVALAATLSETGDTQGSDALVEAVLAEDPGHVAALKLRARRAIETDRTAAAIRDLRSALNQAPEDSETLTLMAMAHEREGARELAGDRLAMAVEVSDAAPLESIRYARFLVEGGRPEPAVAVIREALRRRPADLDLLGALGGIHASQRDWERARAVAAEMRALGTPAAATRATALEAEALSGESRYAETIELLQQLAGEEGGHRTLAGIVQTYVRAGDLAGARTYLEGVRARSPAEPLPRLMLAGLDALEGKAAAAESGYRALIAAHPGFAPAYEGLYLALAGAEPEAAAEVLAEGLAATGEDSRLLFVEAGRLEAAGDVEGAIAAYETLYARDSGSELVANNLASLLSSHRADPAALERAFAIARRLKGSGVPQFQDTYGWIQVRRGEAEEALPALEAAAAALPGEALVLYHLGVAQARLGQPAAARTSLEAALAAAGPSTPAAAMADARALLDELESAPPAAEAEGN
jgi:tetratricopeptide (TPR) repeat protein